MYFVEFLRNIKSAACKMLNFFYLFASVYNDPVLKHFRRSKVPREKKTFPESSPNQSKLLHPQV